MTILAVTIRALMTVRVMTATKKIILKQNKFIDIVFKMSKLKGENNETFIYYFNYFIVSYLFFIF